MEDDEITHGFFNRFEFTRCKLSATRPPERRRAARAAFDRMMVKVQIADTPADGSHGLSSIGHSSTS